MKDRDDSTEFYNKFKTFFRPKQAYSHRKPSHTSWQHWKFFYAL